MNISHLLALSSVFISSAFAQVEAPDTTQESQKWAFIAAPVYSAETSWRLGAVVNRSLVAEQVGDKPSDIDLTFEYSLKNQWRLGLTPSIYSKGNEWHYKAELEAIKWPTTYFGLGAQSQDSINYDAMGFRGKWQTERSFHGEQGWIGLRAITNIESIEFDSSIGTRETPENPYTPDSTAYYSYQNLKAEHILGTEKNRTIGLGFFTSFDTRDHINWPRRGSLISVMGSMQPKWLGSINAYNSTEIQASQFFPAPFASALGFNVIHKANFGDVPFREMAMPDGSKILRGLKNGRYRDKQMLSGGGEWRIPSPLSGFWGLFGLTTFAEGAQVFSDFDHFDKKNWIYSVGGGLRFALNQSNKYNARIDIAQVDNHMSFVVTVREAF
jgi:outer membrane protein assembly factor BamA